MAISALGLDSNNGGEFISRTLVRHCEGESITSPVLRISLRKTIWHSANTDVSSCAWVSRVPNPADRRSSMLALADAGLLLVRAAEAALTQPLEELVGGIADSGQMAAASNVLSVLRCSLERDQIGTPIG